MPFPKRMFQFLSSFEPCLPSPHHRFLPGRSPKLQGPGARSAAAAQAATPLPQPARLYLLRRTDTPRGRVHVDTAGGAGSSPPEETWQGRRKGLGHHRTTRTSPGLCRLRPQARGPHLQHQVGQVDGSPTTHHHHHQRHRNHSSSGWSAGPGVLLLRSTNQPTARRLTAPAPAREPSCYRVLCPGGNVSFRTLPVRTLSRFCECRKKLGCFFPPWDSPARSFQKHRAFGCQSASDCLGLTLPAVCSPFSLILNSGLLCFLTQQGFGVIRNNDTYPHSN